MVASAGFTIRVFNTLSECKNRMFHLSACLYEFARLVTRESKRFDNKDSESQTRVRLLEFQGQN